MSRAAKVLIIDDDSDYLASTRALLESEGYTVVEASGGQDGLAAARKHHPDLIVLDLMMESLQEGYSVNQAIKFAPEYRDLASTPILMMSSMELDPARLLGWIGDTSRITPDAYLVKPIDIPVFLGHVRRLLEAPGESTSAGAAS